MALEGVAQNLRQNQANFLTRRNNNFCVVGLTIQNGPTFCQLVTPLFLKIKTPKQECNGGNPIFNCNGIIKDFYLFISFHFFSRMTQFNYDKSIHFFHVNIADKWVCFSILGKNIYTLFFRNKSLNLLENDIELWISPVLSSKNHWFLSEIYSNIAKQMM